MQFFTPYRGQSPRPAWVVARDGWRYTTNRLRRSKCKHDNGRAKRYCTQCGEYMGEDDDGHKRRSRHPIPQPSF